MISVIVLGYGNVGSQLCRALHKAQGIHVTQIYSRSSKKDFPSNVAIVHALNQLVEADCYFLTLPDDEIANFSKKLPFKNRLVVHTSGSVAMSALSNQNNKGVFYPLQTFTENKPIEFKTIPICIEASRKKDLSLLQKIGNTISENVLEMTSSDRKKIHLAAVWANNFSNHLFYQAAQYLKNNHLDFNLLHPLIEETVSKLKVLSPQEAQTGPAKRGDQQTMKTHLEMLTDEMQKELYMLLSQSITETTKNQ